MSKPCGAPPERLTGGPGGLTGCPMTLAALPGGLSARIHAGIWRSPSSQRGRLPKRDCRFGVPPAQQAPSDVTIASTTRLRCVSRPCLGILQASSLKVVVDSMLHKVGLRAATHHCASGPLHRLYGLILVERHRLPKRYALDLRLRGGRVDRPRERLHRKSSIHRMFGRSTTRARISAPGSRRITAPL